MRFTETTDTRSVRCTDKQTGEFISIMPARMIIKRGLTLEESIERFNADSVSVTMQILAE